MSKVELEVTPAPAQKQDPLQWVTSKMRKACLELEAEAKAALPEGSFLHTIYVSEALARGGYSLARKYNTNVCNGMTIILVVHPLSVEIFASVCSFNVCIFYPLYRIQKKAHANCTSLF